MAIAKGKVTPVYDRVIISDMNFGEQITKAGIIISSDDGKDRGVKPRWGRVVAKGPTNKESYNVGDWILVEHGRWTRGFEVEVSDGKVETMRTVENKGIIGWQTETPDNILFGDATDAGSFSIRPEEFGAN